MIDIPIVLFGYGRVGKAFFSLLREKGPLLRAVYGLNPHVSVALRRRRIGSCGPRSFERGRGRLAWRESTPSTPSDVLERTDTGVLVECLASDVDSGLPGRKIIQDALVRGWHVVTADKSPLIGCLNRILGLARDKGRGIGISAATAAALPTLDTALFSLAGSRIRSFEGILNGTSNYVLTRVRDGLDPETALREARDLGIAEPDPTRDVEGWDTADKVLLLASAVTGTDYGREHIRVSGIRNLPVPMLEQAGRPGKCLKLLGKMSRDEVRGIRLSVAPAVLECGHSLYGVDGTEKGIRFETDTMGAVTVIGGKSDPCGAAAALLKDIINIYR
jgi:homoserine dehydrogenase